MVVVIGASKGEEGDSHRLQPSLVLVSEIWVCAQVMHHRAYAFHGKRTSVQRKKAGVLPAGRQGHDGEELITAMISETDL